MRYIGNKENILDTIYYILSKNGVQGSSFFDFFSGTTSVAKYFKNLGYKIFSSDLMYFSFCLQKAYIENNNEPIFEQLLDYMTIKQGQTLFVTPLDMVISYLNNIRPVQGFIYYNYTPDGTNNLEQPRMYFSSENGEKIDAIRLQIEEWKNNNLILENEYYILLSCLIETISFYANISGVYAAFNKQWDPRSIKPLMLRKINILNNNKINKVYNGNSLELMSRLEADIVYLDPPYNSRQYLPNYHLVETIAMYDYPQIHGVTGMREYGNKKSLFCSKKTALQELENIASNIKCKYLVLSYNSEGIMLEKDIIGILSKYGEVLMEQFEYSRFKSHNQGLSQTKKHVFEQLFILKK